MSTDRVERLGAVDTLSQSIDWATTLPVLVGAYIAVQLATLIPFVGFFVGLLTPLLAGTAALQASAKLDGRTVQFGDAVDGVTGRYVPLLLTSIVYGVIVGIGFVFFVLPGIYLGARLGMALPACAIDGRDVGDSLSASWDASEGNVVKLLGIGLLLFAGTTGAFVFTVFTGAIAVFLGVPTILVSGPMFALSGVAGAIGALAMARVYLENRPSTGRDPATPRTEPTASTGGGSGGDEYGLDDQDF
jgi:hypothetical protein